MLTSQEEFMIGRRIFVLFFVLTIGIAAAQDPQDEALFVRRIIEFWKDRDAPLAIAQIRQFLQDYPTSTYKDSLLVILGDAYGSQQDYLKALEAYSSIQTLHLREKVFNNKLECLYNLDRHQALRQEILPRLPEDLQAPLSADQALWMYYYAEALLHLNSAEARPYLERLMDSEQRHYAASALAHLELAAGHPEHALALYAKVWEGQDEQAGAVALPLIQLLFEQQKYASLIQQQVALRKALKREQHPLLDYYIGRSQYALNNYGEAIGYLRPLADAPLEGCEKNILALLFSCYHHLADAQGMAVIGQKFHGLYPSDDYNAKILYVQAQNHQINNRSDDALKLLEILVNEYPESESHADAAFDRAYILYQKGHWKASREGFMALVKRHPKTPVALMALPYIPNATQQMLDEAAQHSEDVQCLCEQLLQDMQAVLKVPEAIKVSQMPKYYLRLAKVLHDLHRNQAAAELLQVYIKEYPEEPLLDQAYLLLALCTQRLQNLPLFVDAAETFLWMKPEAAEAIPLRLNLFSAYLQLSKSEPCPELMTHKASEHLYQVLLNGNATVRLENKLWLAHIYYDKLQKEVETGGDVAHSSRKEIALRTAFVLEKALQQANGNWTFAFALEPEFIKLSHVYGWLDRRDKQILLLERLKQQQDLKPPQPWTLRAHTLHALGSAYREFGDIATALEYFGQLAGQKTADPLLSTSAKLEWARLSWVALPEEQRSLDNAKTLAILKTLKDLQMRRVLNQEPLHLEAALDYAAMRSALEPAGKHDEYMLSLLRRAKAEFSSADDIWGKNYAASRQMNASQDAIYQAYMTLIDAHILRLEAQNPDERDAALSLYKTLLQGKSVSKYIVEQKRHFIY